MLVGNKVDLALERKVSYHHGEHLSRRWKCPFYETSAKTRLNVEDIFYDLVRQMITVREEVERFRKTRGSGSSLRVAGEKENSNDATLRGCCIIS